MPFHRFFVDRRHHHPSPPSKASTFSPSPPPPKTTFQNFYSSPPPFRHPASPPQSTFQSIHRHHDYHHFSLPSKASIPSHRFFVTRPIEKSLLHSLLKLLFQTKSIRPQWKGAHREERDWQKAKERKGRREGDEDRFATTTLQKWEKSSAFFFLLTDHHDCFGLSFWFFFDLCRILT